MKLLLAVNWKCRDFHSTCIFIFNEALIRTRPCPEPYSWTLFLRCSLCISMTVSPGFLHLLVQTCNLRSLSSVHAHSLTLVCGFLQQDLFAITSSTLLIYCKNTWKAKLYPTSAFFLLGRLKVSPCFFQFKKQRIKHVAVQLCVILDFEHDIKTSLFKLWPQSISVNPCLFWLWRPHNYSKLNFCTLESRCISFTFRNFTSYIGQSVWLGYFLYCLLSNWITLTWLFITRPAF